MKTFASAPMKSSTNAGPRRVEPAAADLLVEPAPRAALSPAGAFHDLRNMEIGVAADSLRPNGSGSRLPARWRGQMESVFNADLSDVRLHVNHKPSLIGARAYAQGSHIHLSPDIAQPDSGVARRIMAHEVAHVLQQREGRVARGATINADPGLEAEADGFGIRAMQGHAPRSPPAPLAAAVARAPSLSATAPVQPYWVKVGSTYRWVDKKEETKPEGSAAHPVDRRQGQTTEPLSIRGQAIPVKTPAERSEVLKALPLFPSFPPGKVLKAKPKSSSTSDDLKRSAPRPVTTSRVASHPGQIAKTPTAPVSSGDIETKAVSVQPQASVATMKPATIVSEVTLSGPPKPTLRPKALPSAHSFEVSATTPEAIRPAEKTKSALPSPKGSPATPPRVTLNAPPTAISVSSSLDEKVDAGHELSSVVMPPAAQQADESLGDPFLAWGGGFDEKDDQDQHVSTQAYVPTERDLNKQAKKAKKVAARLAEEEEEDDDEKPKNYEANTERWMSSVGQTALYQSVNKGSHKPFFTRHHINPKRQLAEFYNSAAARGHLEALDPLMQAVVGHHEARRKQFASNSEANDLTQDEILAEWKHLKTRGNKPKNNLAAQTLSEMYQWFPGNLMVGPSSDRRTDDPGSKFEKDAKPIVDKDAASHNGASGPTAFQHHKAASDAMAHYLGPWDEKDSKADATQREHAKEVADHLTAAAKLRAEDAYPYDENQWERVETKDDPKKKKTKTDGNDKPKKEWKIRKSDQKPDNNAAS
jgi:hypothetical protein